MIHIYNFFATLFALAFAPLFIAWSLATGKKRRGLWNHFGILPPLSSDGKSGKTLWLHALSMGEVTAAAPVLQRIRNERPDIRVVVSVTTDSGYDAAKRQLPFAARILFHPFDGWPFLALALGRIRPDIFVLTETGFWPGLLRMLRRREIPALLFHGRISKKSMRQYQLFRPFVSGVLNSFHTLCMQNAQELENALKLGADVSRLQDVGDTKYDALKTVSESERRRVRETLRIPARCPVVVAGSTHEGEEEIVLDAFQKLRARYPDLALILAPRRLERVSDIASLLDSRKIPFVKRTDLDAVKPGEEEKPVILLDTMGELFSVYSVCEIAFVGKSLLPPGGGHSLIEPAALGKIVLHGPYMEYNQAAAAELGKHGVAFVVRNAAELEKEIGDLLDNALLREELSQKAQAFIEDKKGASKRMAEIIFRALNEKT